METENKGIFWGLDWKTYSELGRLGKDYGLNSHYENSNKYISGFWCKKAVKTRWNHRRMAIGKDVGKMTNPKGILQRVGQAVIPALLIFGGALGLFLLIRHGQTGLSYGEILKGSWNWTINGGTHLSQFVKFGLPAIFGATVIGSGALAHARHKNYIEYIEHSIKKDLNKNEMSQNNLNNWTKIKSSD